MRVLVVEDEAGIRELLVRGLSEDAHEVTTAVTAESAMGLVSERAFEAYLLDITLPGLSGNELCRWLRDQGCKQPILMLTARSTLDDKLLGLDSGADDYLTKPFEIAEVRARLKAFQRKSQGYPRSTVTVADLVLDPNQRTAARGGVDLDLSKKEFQLLEYLARNHDRVVSRSMIAQAVWNSETNLYTNVIDVFVAYLRKKVDTDQQLKLIHTVRGKGFVLSEQQPGAKP
ncbi:MAG: response regulator transcription factor [Spirochaetales bacterium]